MKYMYICRDCNIIDMREGSISINIRMRCVVLGIAFFVFLNVEGEVR